MNIVKKTPLPTKELIYDNIDQVDLFKRYITAEFSIGKAFHSPFRKDNSPSCCIYMGQDGILRFKDYASDDFSGDIFELVEKLYGLDFISTIEKIAGDFNLISSKGYQGIKKQLSASNEQINRQKRYVFIQVSTKAFTRKDLDWWNSYHIDISDLRREEVYSIKECFINRKRWPLIKDELAFAYYRKGSFKCYFPERPKDEKWRTNIPLKEALHLENLNSNYNSLIVKSLKDYMVVYKVYPYICALQNESLGSCPQEVADFITTHSKSVYYGGDCDSQGKAASYKITGKYNWLHINPPDNLMPEGKDFADLAKIRGMQAVENHLKLKQVI